MEVHLQYHQAALLQDRHTAKCSQQPTERPTGKTYRFDATPPSSQLKEMNEALKHIASTRHHTNQTCPQKEGFLHSLKRDGFKQCYRERGRIQRRWRTSESSSDESSKRERLSYRKVAARSRSPRQSRCASRRMDPPKIQKTSQASMDKEAMENLISEEVNRRVKSALMNIGVPNPDHRTSICRILLNEPICACLMNEPICACLMNELTPEGFEFPSSEEYDGTGDPIRHIKRYRILMGVTTANDALMCRVFSLTLKGCAAYWYDRYPARFFQSFNHMANEFVEHFIACIPYEY